MRCCELADLFLKSKPVFLAGWCGCIRKHGLTLCGAAVLNSFATATPYAWARTDKLKLINSDPALNSTPTLRECIVFHEQGAGDQMKEFLLVERVVPKSWIGGKYRGHLLHVDPQTRAQCDDVPDQFIRNDDDLTLSIRILNMRSARRNEILRRRSFVSSRGRA
jgi:hypothetical protein